MADEKFSWLFELIDKVSKPAHAGEQALGSFEKEITKVKAQIDRINKDQGGFKALNQARQELSGLKREMGGGSHRGGLVDEVRELKNIEGVRLLGEGLHFAWEMGVKVADTLIDIGKDAFRAAGEAERFSISFKSLLGDKVGEETLKYIDHISRSTELTTSELKRMTSELLRAGFTSEQLQNALPASLDVAGFLGGGVGNVDAAVSALTRLKLTGQASKRSLMALGLAERDVLEQLKKDTGLSVEELKKKMTGGKLNPDALLKAVYETIAVKQHGALGTTAEKMGKTIDAQWKKLQNLPDRFFEGLADSPAFSNFESFLGRLVDELSPESEFGQKAMAEVTGIFTDLFGNISTGEGINGIKDGLLDAIKEARTLVPALKDVGGAVVEILKGVAALVRGIHEFKEDIVYLRGDKKPALSGGPVNANSPEWKRLGLGGKTQTEIDRIKNVMPFAAIGAGSVLADTPAIPSQASRVNRNDRGGHHTHVGGIRVEVNVHGNATEEDADRIGEATAGKVQQSVERVSVGMGARL